MEFFSYSYSYKTVQFSYSHSNSFAKCLQKLVVHLFVIFVWHIVTFFDLRLKYFYLLTFIKTRFSKPALALLISEHRGHHSQKEHAPHMLVTQVLTQSSAITAYRQLFSNFQFLSYCF